MQGALSWQSFRPSAAGFAAKGLQYDPDERQRCNAKAYGGQVIARVGSLDGFVADIIGHRATDSCDHILPKVITGNALRSLQEQYDQSGKDDDRSPVVWRFHALNPKFAASLTTVMAAFATAIDGLVTA